MQQEPPPRMDSSVCGPRLPQSPDSSPLCSVCISRSEIRVFMRGKYSHITYINTYPYHILKINLNHKNWPSSKELCSPPTPHPAVDKAASTSRPTRPWKHSVGTAALLMPATHVVGVMCEGGSVHVCPQERGDEARWGKQQCLSGEMPLNSTWRRLESREAGPPDRRCHLRKKVSEILTLEISIYLMEIKW